MLSMAPTQQQRQPQSQHHLPLQMETTAQQLQGGGDLSRVSTNKFVCYNMQQLPQSHHHNPPATAAASPKRTTTGGGCTPGLKNLVQCNGSYGRDGDGSSDVILAACNNPNPMAMPVNAPQPPPPVEDVMRWKEFRRRQKMESRQRDFYRLGQENTNVATASNINVNATENNNVPVQGSGSGSGGPHQQQSARGQPGGQQNKHTNGSEGGRRSLGDKISKKVPGENNSDGLLPHLDSLSLSLSDSTMGQHQVKQQPNSNSNQSSSSVLGNNSNSSGVQSKSSDRGGVVEIDSEGFPISPTSLNSDELRKGKSTEEDSDEQQHPYGQATDQGLAAAVPNPNDISQSLETLADNCSIAKKRLLSIKHNTNITNHKSNNHNSASSEVNSCHHSEVPTEITSNTARYVATQSNLMARRMMSANLLDTTADSSTAGGSLTYSNSELGTNSSIFTGVTASENDSRGCGGGNNLPNLAALTVSTSLPTPTNNNTIVNTTATTGGNHDASASSKKPNLTVSTDLSTPANLNLKALEEMPRLLTPTVAGGGVGVGNGGDGGNGNNDDPTPSSRMHQPPLSTASSATAAMGRMRLAATPFGSEQLPTTPSYSNFAANTPSNLSNSAVAYTPRTPYGGGGTPGWDPTQTTVNNSQIDQVIGLADTPTGVWDPTRTTVNTSQIESVLAYTPQEEKGHQEAGKNDEVGDDDAWKDRYEEEEEDGENEFPVMPPSPLIMEPIPEDDADEKHDVMNASTVSSNWDPMEMSTVVAGGTILEEGEDNSNDCADPSATAGANNNVVFSPSEKSRESQQSNISLGLSPSSTASNNDNVPTLSEVNDFMSQLRQLREESVSAKKKKQKEKHQVGSLQKSRSEDLSSCKKNRSLSSKASSIKKSASLESSILYSPLSSPIEGFDYLPAASEDEVVLKEENVEFTKSLMERKEKLRKHKLEADRKKKEFDERLKAIRSKVYAEDATTSDVLDGSNVFSGIDDESKTSMLPGVDTSMEASYTKNNSVAKTPIAAKASPQSSIYYFPTDEKQARPDTTGAATAQQHDTVLQSSGPLAFSPMVPAARWSGGLARWSPANNTTTTTATTPQAAAAPSPHQTKLNISIDEDDFSFRPPSIVGAKNNGCGAGGGGMIPISPICTSSSNAAVKKEEEEEEGATPAGAASSRFNFTFSPDVKSSQTMRTGEQLKKSSPMGNLLTTIGNAASSKLTNAAANTRLSMSPTSKISLSPVTEKRSHHSVQQRPNNSSKLGNTGEAAAEVLFSSATPRGGQPHVVQNLSHPEVPSFFSPLEPSHSRSRPSAAEAPKNNKSGNALFKSSHHPGALTIDPSDISSPPVTTPTSDMSEGDRGGGFGFADIRYNIRSDKSIVSKSSSKFVELGQNINISAEDPPDDDESEASGPNVLGMSVRGSKKKKRKKKNKRHSPPVFETVEEQSKCSLSTHDDENEGGESLASSVDNGRKPLDPDGSYWEELQEKAMAKLTAADSHKWPRNQEQILPPTPAASRLDFVPEEGYDNEEPESTAAGTRVKNAREEVEEGTNEQDFVATMDRAKTCLTPREEGPRVEELVFKPVANTADPRQHPQRQQKQLHTSNIPASLQLEFTPDEQEENSNEMQDLNFGRVEENAVAQLDIVMDRARTCLTPREDKRLTPSEKGLAPFDERHTGERKINSNTAPVLSLDVVHEGYDGSDNKEYSEVMNRVKACLTPKNNYHKPIDEEENPEIMPAATFLTPRNGMQPHTPRFGGGAHAKKQAFSPSAVSATSSIHELRSKFEPTEMSVTSTPATSPPKKLPDASEGQHASCENEVPPPEPEVAQQREARSMFEHQPGSRRVGRLKPFQVATPPEQSRVADRFHVTKKEAQSSGDYSFGNRSTKEPKKASSDGLPTWKMNSYDKHSTKDSKNSTAPKALDKDIQEVTSEEKDIDITQSKSSESISIKDLRSRFESRKGGEGDVPDLQKSSKDVQVESSTELNKPAATEGSTRIGSGVYLKDREIQAMSSLGSETIETAESQENEGGTVGEVTLGDGTIGDGTIDTKKVLKYAKILERRGQEADDGESSIKSFDNCIEKKDTINSTKENHPMVKRADSNASSAISDFCPVKMRKKAFESRNTRKQKPQTISQVVLKKTPERKKANVVMGPKKETSPTRSKKENSMSPKKEVPRPDIAAATDTPMQEESPITSVKDRIAVFGGTKTAAVKASNGMSPKAQHYQPSPNKVVNAPPQHVNHGPSPNKVVPLQQQQQPNVALNRGTNNHKNAATPPRTIAMNRAGETPSPLWVTNRNNGQMYSPIDNFNNSNNNSDNNNNKAIFKTNVVVSRLPSNGSPVRYPNSAPPPPPPPPRIQSQNKMKNNDANRGGTDVQRPSPLQTRYESPLSRPEYDDDEEDGITLSPTFSEVSGLTLPTCLATVNGDAMSRVSVDTFDNMSKNGTLFHETMSPIARHRKQQEKAVTSRGKGGGTKISSHPYLQRVNSKNKIMNNSAPSNPAEANETTTDRSHELKTPRARGGLGGAAVAGQAANNNKALSRREQIVSRVMSSPRNKGGIPQQSVKSNPLQGWPDGNVEKMGPKARSQEWQGRNISVKSKSSKARSQEWQEKHAISEHDNSRSDNISPIRHFDGRGGASERPKGKVAESVARVNRRMKKGQNSDNHGGGSNQHQRYSRPSSDTSNSYGDSQGHHNNEDRGNSLATPDCIRID